MRYIDLYWDPDKELFIDNNGLEVEYSCKWVPIWALELARIYHDRGELCFNYPLDASTTISIFWPDEEDENWYL